MLNLRKAVYTMKLSQMVPGQEYIRIIPVGNDWSFTRNVMIFDGISENGNMLIHFRDESHFTKTFGNQPKEVPYRAGWMPANILFEGMKSELSKYEGHYIKQIQPILLRSGITPIPSKSAIPSRRFSTSNVYTRTHTDYFDKSYMSTPVKLLSATQYHLVIEVNGVQKILDSRYAKPGSWILAE